MATDKPKKEITQHFKIRFGLRIRLILLSIIFITLFLGSVSYIYISRERKFLENRLVSISFGLLENFSKSLSFTDLREDFITQIIDIIKGIKVSKDIDFAVVLNKNDKIFLSSDIEGKYFKPGEYPSIAGIYDGIKKVNISKESYFKVSDFRKRKRKGSLYIFIKPVKNFKGDKYIGRAILVVSDENLRKSIEENIKNSLYLMGIFLLVGIISAFLFGTLITNPIIKLSYGARKIGEGNLEHKINVKRKDEIGFLAYEFNEMTSKLKKAKEMEIEKVIMDEQIEIAKDIQKGLNPSNKLSFGCIEVKGYSRPAKGVGGDYYDYVIVEPPWVATLISDVSGKGVPASLLMVMIRTVFKSLIKQEILSAKKIVDSINKTMAGEIAIDRFVTMFFIFINTENGEIHFVNAGHSPLFMYRKEINRCSIMRIMGFPIGLDEDSEYNQGKTHLKKGDIILLNTDGIIEARNPQKEEYGKIRLQKKLIEFAHLSVEEIVKKIIYDVDSFAENAPQHDDMTLVVLKRIH
jgi:serine phosphatase RsbU (regulator of sigma subunit)